MGEIFSEENGLDKNHQLTYMTINICSFPHCDLVKISFVEIKGHGLELYRLCYTTGEHEQRQCYGADFHVCLFKFRSQLKKIVLKAHFSVNLYFCF